MKVYKFHAFLKSDSEILSSQCLIKYSYDYTIDPSVSIRYDFVVLEQYVIFKINSIVGENPDKLIKYVRS
jgi:hypothetical protein